MTEQTSQLTFYEWLILSIELVDSIYKYHRNKKNGTFYFYGMEIKYSFEEKPIKKFRNPKKIRFKKQ